MQFYVECRASIIARERDDVKIFYFYLLRDTLNQIIICFFFRIIMS